MKILFVESYNEYDATMFEQNFKPTIEVWNKVKCGEILNVDCEGTQEQLKVQALEFDNIDKNFIKFIKSEICDYDDLKHANFYVIEE